MKLYSLKWERMKKLIVRKWMLVGVLASILLLGACGKVKIGSSEKPDEKGATEKVEAVEVEEVEEETDESDEPAEEEKDEVNEAGDAEILNHHIAEETGGDVEVIFTNKSPELKHAYSEDVIVEIEEYQVVHVTNMNESSKHVFDDEDEGYVLSFKLTFTNEMDEDVYYTASTMMLSDDATENLYMRSYLVNRDDWITDESTDDVSQYTKEKSFTGMQAYTMTKAQFEKLEAPKLTISKPYVENDTSKMFGEEAVFFLPITDEGTKKAAATSGLYADKMLTDSVADKELFFSEENISETESIEDVKVTLEGVQYANITPTAGHAERFENFGDGPLVALTAKFTVENNSDSTMIPMLIEKKLILDQNRGTMRSEGMLEPTVFENIEPGDTTEEYAVFLFRKDEFDLLKELELQFGPLVDENAKKLFKEKSVTFTLPMKE